MSEKYYDARAIILGEGRATEADLREQLKAHIATAPLTLAIFTDAVRLTTTGQLLDEISDDERLSRVLEVRAFGEDAELHAVRSAMGSAFSGRYIEDGDIDDENHFDERQILDIARNDCGHCTTIGGGEFDLPEGYETATKICIRNYLDYDADGLAQVVDFRILGLE